MKMLSAAAAAFTIATSLVLGPLPASAGESRTWNASPGEAQNLLNEGARLCYGDAKKKRQSICSVYDPSSRIRVTSVNVRPDGLSKNLHYIMVSPTDANGIPLRDDHGRPVVIAGHVAEQANAAAIWNQGLSNVPAAAFNGAVGSGIAALSNPCRGDSVCNSTIVAVDGAEALSFAESFAGAEVGITSTGGGTCGSGGCPTGRK